MPPPPRRAPAGRYGRQDGSGPSRPLKWAGAVVLGVLSVIVAYVFARGAAGNPNRIEAGVLGLDLRADSVTVRFEVSRAPDRSVLCVLRARDKTGAEIARAEVPVPADPGGPRRTTLSYDLATTGRPVTGEVFSCGYPSG